MIGAQFRWVEPEDTGGRDVYLYHLQMMAPAVQQVMRLSPLRLWYMLLRSWCVPKHAVDFPLATESVRHLAVSYSKGQSQ